MHILTLMEQIEAGKAFHIIDVREDFEVAQGKLKMATHIPMHALPDRLDELDKDTPYYIVCAHAVRSAQVTAYLQGLGYNAINVEGGMAEIM